MGITPASWVAQAFGSRSEMVVSLVDASTSTYSASASNFSAFSGQILQMAGNANTVVRITRIEITLTALVAVAALVSLQRFSTSATGTATPLTVVRNDTSNAAPQSVPATFSSAPTLGNLVGFLRAAQTGVAVAAPQSLVWDFGNSCSQSIVLRGPSEFIGIVLGSIGASTVTAFSVEWTESPS